MNRTARTDWLSAQDYQELLNSGYEESTIHRVPHFTASPEEVSKLLGRKLNCSGLAFVYTDIDGNPLKVNGSPFVRVKMRRSEEEIKAYGKYNSPSNGGCHFYLSTLINWREVTGSLKPVIIIEGEKKADVLCQEGEYAIGIGGVWSWKSKDPLTEESQAIDDFNYFEWKNRIVYLCPDSDIKDGEKPQIKNAMRELAMHLQGLGADVRLIILPSQLDGSKMGADDFVAAYGADKFKILKKYAQPAIGVKAGAKKTAQVILNMEPPEAARQVEIISWLLSKNYAYRSGAGWYEWTGQHWKMLDQTRVTGIVNRAYKSQQWDLNSIGQVVFAEKMLPSYLHIRDEEWNKFGYIFFSNGTYNPTMKLFTSSFNKSLYSTLLPLPFPYTENPGTPQRFLQFLEEATGGDTKTIELLQAIMRYTWMPKNAAEKFPIEACFDFFGGKGTGKSTFLEVMIAGLGKDSVSNADPVVFSSPERLSCLLDKRAAISTDVSGHLERVGLFNNVVSNEIVQVRKLYKDPLDTRLGVVVLRSYNKFLSVGQGSQGLDRRIIAIEFNNPPKHKDIHLQEKLTKELPQIFAWAFSINDEVMLRRILTRNQSELAAKASVGRFIDNNPIFQFLLENYEEEGVEKIKANELYSRYVNWCELQHMKPVKHSNFCFSIEEFGCKPYLKEDGTPILHQRYKLYKVPAMNSFDIRKHVGFTNDEEWQIEAPPVNSEEPQEVPLTNVTSEEYEELKQEIQADFNFLEAVRSQAFESRTENDEEPDVSLLESSIEELTPHEPVGWVKDFLELEQNFSAHDNM